jgi:hypothetical protein
MAPPLHTHQRFFLAWAQVVNTLIIITNNVNIIIIIIIYNAPTLLPRLGTGVMLCYVMVPPLHTHQRFFLAWAQVRREKSSNALKMLAMNNINIINIINIMVINNIIINNNNNSNNSNDDNNIPPAAGVAREQQQGERAQDARY